MRCDRHPDWRHSLFCHSESAKRRGMTKERASRLCNGKKEYAVLSTAPRPEPASPASCTPLPAPDQSSHNKTESGSPRRHHDKKPTPRPTPLLSLSTGTSTSLYWSSPAAM